MLDRALSSRSRQVVRRAFLSTGSFNFPPSQRLARFASASEAATATRHYVAPDDRQRSRPARGQRKAHALLLSHKPSRNLNHRKYDDPSSSGIFLDQFRTAIAQGNADDAFEIYCKLGPSLEGLDVGNLVKLLQQNAVNPQSPNKNRWNLCAQRIADDLTSGKINPHSEPLTILLWFFKDTGNVQSGIKLWNWSQENLVGALGFNAFAAAIELLLESGADLQTLEALWQRALADNPRNFSAYHMSPNAILPDRTQLWVGSEADSTILNAISLARLRHGDTRNAYLSLDTALRLFPNMHRFSVLAVFIQERPIVEAFTILQIASRQGGFLPPKVVSRMLEDLDGTHRILGKGKNLLKETLIQLDILHAIVGASLNKVSKDFFGRLLTVMYSVCKPKASSCPTSMRPAVAGLFCRVLTLMEKLNIAHDRSGSTMNKIFSAAAKLRSDELFIQASKMALQHPPTSLVQCRVLIRTAGAFGDLDLLRESWQSLLSINDPKETESEPYKNISTLLNACTEANAMDFFEKQSKIYKGLLSPSDQSSFDEWLAFARNQTTKSTSVRKEWRVDELTRIVDKTNSICDVLESTKHYDFRKYPLPMKISRRKILASDEELRKVYDKMTSDPNRPAPSVKHPAMPTPICPNGFPIDELRYQNWKAMNELLAEAEAENTSPIQRVEASFEDGKENVLSGQALEDEIRRLRTPQATPLPAAKSATPSDFEGIEILDS